MVLLLLPLIGSMFASGAAILLNPEPETRRIVIGRSIIALVIGIAGPQLLGMAWDKFDATTIKPVILLLIGFVFAAVAYILSRPFFAQAYARSSATAAELLRRANIPKDDDKKQP
jgi:hypothetical protein